MQAKLFAPDELEAIAPEWETLVQSNPASGFMQSLRWAAFKRTQQMTAIPIGVFENSTLIGGAIFHTADFNKGTGIMVAPDGPFLPWHEADYARDALRAIVTCAESYAKANGQIALRIQPRLSPPALLNEYEFGRAPVDLTPRETLFLDLSTDESELLAQMKHKTRYNLRLSAKKGVVVQENHGNDALRQFYKLMLESAGRDGFYVEPFSFFEDLVKTLAPDGMIRLFFATHEDDVLGTLMLLTYGKRATYLYGGIGNIKRNLMIGYAMQWAAITAAREAGATEYDFYGFDQLQSPLNNYARFSRFKGGFGGTPVRYIGAQDYFFLDTLADAIVKAVSEVDWPEVDEADEKFHPQTDTRCGDVSSASRPLEVRM
jgi:peptidoglycan pentaglycine glycine transferase (the first glycine)